MSWGAEGLAYIFRLKNDHTGFLKSDGTTAATALADALHVFGASSGDKFIESTDWSYDDVGLPTIKIAQSEFNATLMDMISATAGKKASSGSLATKSEYTAENGRKIGGTASSGDTPNVLLLHYGAKDEAGNIPVTANIGYMKKSSGARSTKGGALVMPSIEFVGLAALADIDIPVVFFDTEVVAAPAAAQAFLKDYYEHVFALAPKA